MSLFAYEDPEHEGNQSTFHTGKPCIEKGCSQPAGTAWSPFWCFPCNVVRITRISKNMEEILKSFEPDPVLA